MTSVSLTKATKDPSEFPQLKGVEWVQTDYSDKKELVDILRGVNTVLCFFAVHLDPGSENQKRLIDAAVEASVKRFAPSEWGTSVTLENSNNLILTSIRGVKLADSLDIMSWYSGKVEVAKYLENLNSEKKVAKQTNPLLLRYERS